MSTRSDEFKKSCIDAINGQLNDIRGCQDYIDSIKTENTRMLGAFPKKMEDLMQEYMTASNRMVADHVQLVNIEVHKLVDSLADVIAGLSDIISVIDNEQITEAKYESQFLELKNQFSSIVSSLESYDNPYAGDNNSDSMTSEEPSEEFTEEIIPEDKESVSENITEDVVPDTKNQNVTDESSAETAEEMTEEDHKAEESSEVASENDAEDTVTDSETDTIEESDNDNLSVSGDSEESDDVVVSTDESTTVVQDDDDDVDSDLDLTELHETISKDLSNDDDEYAGDTGNTDTSDTQPEDVNDKDITPVQPELDTGVNNQEAPNIDKVDGDTSENTDMSTPAVEMSSDNKVTVTEDEAVDTSDKSDVKSENTVNTVPQDKANNNISPGPQSLAALLARSKKINNT